MSFLGIKGKDVSNFGWLFGILILLFIGLPLFFRLRYFRDIPKGWTRSQFKKWQEIEGKSQKIVDSFSRKYWLVVLGICVLIVGLGIVFNKEIMLGIPPVLIISFFVYMYKMAYQNYKKMNKIKLQNEVTVYVAGCEAQDSNGKKKFFIVMSVFVFFIILFMVLSIR